MFKDQKATKEFERVFELLRADLKKRRKFLRAVKALADVKAEADYSVDGYYLSAAEIKRCADKLIK